MDAVGPEQAATAAPGQKSAKKPPQGRPGGERPQRSSPAFEAFYRLNLVDTGLMDAEEWDSFLGCLNRALPSSLWITPTAHGADKVRDLLQESVGTVEALRARLAAPGGGEAAAARGMGEAPEMFQLAPLLWLPGNMGWRFDVPKAILRKSAELKPLHEALIEHTARGTINRMEEVSMLPVALLDVGAGHRCLDMCAAPGSKTAQMLAVLAEANFKRWGRGLEDLRCTQECVQLLRGRIDYSADEGFVIANDASTERCGMLVHQIARHQSLYPLVVFTSHDARFFPSIREPDGAEVRFDRVLCDVMCSSDGTLRKAPHLWREWSAKTALELHADQLAVALRGARLLRIGGRMVYSTCSMSPVENEAVVAEILRRAGGALQLVDARGRVAPLRTCEGLRRWHVTHPGDRSPYASYEAAVQGGGLHRLLCPGNFPPAEGSKEGEALSRCVRVLPHHNDTSGFFIAVFDKVCDLRPPQPADGSDERDGSGYDSGADEDGEELQRREQLRRLEAAIAAGRSEQERAKALSRRERVRKSGSLARELCRYRNAADDMPDAVERLSTFYGLHVQFPRRLLFRRYQLDLDAEGELVQAHHGDAHQLVLFAAGAARVLAAGTGDHARRKLRVVAGGLRAFVQDRFVTSGRASPFRFGQEALEMMLPYVGERVVTLEDPADAALLVEATGRNAPTAALRSAGRRQLEALDAGGCVLLARGAGAGLVPMSALRTQNAVNLYINDLMVPALREVCGLPPLARAEEAPASSGVAATGDHG